MSPVLDLPVEMWCSRLHIEVSVSFSRYGKLGFTPLFMLCCLYYCFIILKCLVCWCEHRYGNINPLVNLLGVCARENSGENWFSRPSEYGSPRRDQQRLAPDASRERSFRPPTLLLSERASRLSEIPHEATVPIFEPLPRPRGIA